jgi:hypothetical protein
MKCCWASGEDCWSLHTAGLDNVGCANRLRPMEQEERGRTNLCWSRCEEKTAAILS